MKSVTEVSVARRRVLNQALLHAGRIPDRALADPGAYVRALRSALRMSLGQLSRRSGVPKAHIVQLEAGLVDARLSTVRRLFRALFCGLVVLPTARLRPSEAVARRRLEPAEDLRWRWRLWDD